LLHGAHAGFAVAIGSGQDDADDSLLQALRRRLEEVFGGGPGAMHFLRLRERERASCTMATAAGKPLEWFSKKWSFRAFHHFAGVSAGNDPTGNPTVGRLGADRSCSKINVPYLCSVPMIMQ